MFSLTVATGTQVIDVVHSFGGDVIKFAGDAVIIAFYPDCAELGIDDNGYTRAVKRCAHCALQVCPPLHQGIALLIAHNWRDRMLCCYRQTAQIGDLNYFCTTCLSNLSLTT